MTDTVHTHTHTHTHGHSASECKNNKLYKNCIKSVIFILIFCIIWHYCFSVLWVSKTPIYYFYKEPKNSIDITYIGSSNAFAHFNTVLAYNQYGFTTGMMSTNTQPFSVIKYLIKESEKRQKPKLYVIDITRVADDFKSFSKAGIRNNTDSMKFSKNRIDAINELLSYSDVDKEEYINYYFSFFMYHNVWKNINKSKFIDSTLYKGYLLDESTTKKVAQNYYNWTNNVIKLPQENKKVLLDLIEYIESNKLNVLFVVPIKTFSENANGRINDAISIIQEYNLNLINFNTLDDFGVDFSTDLYNGDHLNVYGATKYTLYFGKYLKEHYDLPDHRNDEKYNSWESEYERYKQEFNILTGKNFDDILLEYQK